MCASCPVKGTFYCGFFKNSFKFTTLTVVPSDGFDELHTVTQEVWQAFLCSRGINLQAHHHTWKSEYSLTPFFQKCYFFQVKSLPLNSLPFSLFDCYQSWNFHGSTGHLSFLFFICSQFLSTFAFFYPFLTYRNLKNIFWTLELDTLLIFFFIKKCNTWWSLEIQRS